MMVVDAIEIAATLLRDFTLQGAIRYAESIARCDGPLGPAYAQAADILKAKQP